VFNNHIPMFTNQASCFDKGYDPDWWHPQELAGKGRKWSHTPEAELARSICHSCPAKRECRSYALQYFNLTGIWGGMDRLERHAMQVALNMNPINWTDTYESAVYTVPHQRREDV
jgi:WhiB family redox-sensing transcriptional regulator